MFATCLKMEKNKHSYLMTKFSGEGEVEDKHVRTLKKKVIGTDERERQKENWIWNTDGNIAVNRRGHTSKVKEYTRDNGD